MLEPHGHAAQIEQLLREANDLSPQRSGSASDTRAQRIRELWCAAELLTSHDLGGFRLTDPGAEACREFVEAMMGSRVGGGAI